jgi:AcrR family transcriptional regulator
MKPMGRPRTKSNAAVLEAAAVVFGRTGPSFTLADVAKEAGLAPATLVQRFGSKRGLLLALSKTAAEGADACFAQIRARHRSPLRTLFACFEFTAGMAQTPEMLANNLAFLQMDLTDPEFRQWTLLNARSTAAGYEALILEAIRAKELKRCDAAALARLINATLHGSMVSWAFFQEGSAADWVRRDMEALLKPYRPTR